MNWFQKSIFSNYNHRVPNPALPGELYSSIIYSCEEGYKLETPQLDTLFCSENKWIGQQPKCLEVVKKDPRPTCPPLLARKCDQLCFLDSNQRPLCECHPGIYTQRKANSYLEKWWIYCVGYDLEPDGRTCTDNDECKILNGGCDHTCINKPGTYLCDCRPGYKVFPSGFYAQIRLFCENNEAQNLLFN